MLLIDKTKQQLQNNILYGENDRNKNRIAHLAGLKFQEQAAVLSLVEPDPSKVWLIDISHWDGNVALSVTKSKGAAGVFIKGVDGTIRTKFFPENRQRAVDAKLPHAPYGWLYRDVNVSCVSQARAYTDLVNQYPPELLPVIDFEWTNYGGQSANPNYEDLRKWATEWLRLGNPKAIMYSAAGYMNGFGKIPSDIKAMFADIWIANYGVSAPTMPLGYVANEWEFWQFTASGSAVIYAPNDNGKKELDLNYFNGTHEQFAAKYGTNGGTPMPTPTYKEYTATLMQGANMRIEPGVNASINPIAAFPTGSKLKGKLIVPDKYGVSREWLEVYDIDGLPRPGWICTNLMKDIVEVPATGGGVELPATATTTFKDGAGNVIASYIGQKQ